MRLILFIFLLTVACSESKYKQIEFTEPDYKYTVWVGSAVFSVGHRTNQISDSLGFIYFEDVWGEKYMVPKTSVKEIVLR